MDNKQAAKTLRKYAAYWATKLDRKNERKAAERGADAIEMLEWLTEYTSGKEFMALRVLSLYSKWAGEGSFRAYCETRFRERAK